MTTQVLDGVAEAPAAEQIVGLANVQVDPDLNNQQALVSRALALESAVKSTAVRRAMADLDWASAFSDQSEDEIFQSIVAPVRARIRAIRAANYALYEVPSGVSFHRNNFTWNVKSISQTLVRGTESKMRAAWKAVSQAIRPS